MGKFDDKMQGLDEFGNHFQKTVEKQIAKEERKLLFNQTEQKRKDNMISDDFFKHKSNIRQLLREVGETSATQLEFNERTLDVLIAHGKA